MFNLVVYVTKINCQKSKETSMVHNMFTKLLYMINEKILPKNTADVSIVLPGVQAASGWVVRPWKNTFCKPSRCRYCGCPLSMFRCFHVSVRLCWELFALVFIKISTFSFS